MSNNEKGGKSVLLELVEKTEYWFAFDFLKSSTLEERRTILTNVFMRACAHHDDESALLWFTWLLQAIQEDEDSRLELTEAMDFQTKEAAKKAAEIQTVLVKADIAKGLYRELPSFRLEPARYANETGTKHPTLLKTKKAMLESIAGGWKSAPTNEVTDEFFVFFYKIDSGILLSGPGEKELVSEVVRKVTDSSFPLARLMYTLRNHQGAFEDILGLAWARNSAYYYHRYPGPGSQMGLILAAVGDFYGASPEATKLLGHIGAKILAVDRQLNSLNDVPIDVFGPPKLEFIYGEPNGVPTQVFNEVLVHFKTYGLREEELHRAFESVRARILEAQKGWPVQVKIKLRGKLMDRFSDRAIHQRTEDI